MNNADFFILCRNYYPQKEILLSINKPVGVYGDEMIEKRTDVIANRKIASFESEIISESLYECERIFEEIELKCGDKAKKIMWEYYVDKKTIETLAHEHSISVRTLKRKIAKWKANVDIT